MDTSTNNISLDRIIRRAKDVMSFNTRTYEEIVRDPSATMEAAIVVATVAIASGLGRIFDGGGALVGAVIAMLIGWVVSAVVIYMVGTKVTGRPDTSSSVERVMRIVGYAAVPGIFSLFTGLWLIGWLIATILFFWLLATMVLAIRASLDMTIGQAILTGVVAWIANLIATGLIWALFGINPTFPFS